MSTRKDAKRDAPVWLEATVYEPKRQRTYELVKQAIDALVEQRKQDGMTRVSLATIIAKTKQQDSTGQGIAHTTILENAEAYAYYKRYRTAKKTTKQLTQKKAHSRTGLVIKPDRDLTRVRQRYLKLSREDLVEQLLSVEQQYAELYERHLTLNDKLLEYQLRAEQAEAQLEMRQKSTGRKK